MKAIIELKDGRTFSSRTSDDLSCSEKDNYGWPAQKTILEAENDITIIGDEHPMTNWAYADGSEIVGYNPLVDEPCPQCGTEPCLDDVLTQPGVFDLGDVWICSVCGTSEKPAEIRRSETLANC